MYRNRRDLVCACSPSAFHRMLTLGSFVEMRAEGGWWEVELLGASSGPLGEPPATPLVTELDDDEPAASAAAPPAGASGEEGGADVLPANAPAPDAASADAEARALADGATPAAAALAGAEAAAKVQAERAAAARARADAAREAADRATGGGDADAAAATSAATPAVAAEAPVTYTVRLLNAPSEFVGVYDEISIDDLRPGWQFKNGRWAGRWAHGTLTKAEERKLEQAGLVKVDGTGGSSPKAFGSAGNASPAKKARKSGGGAKAAVVSEAEQALIFARVQERWPIGKKVEVVQSDAGLTGAWFEGEVIGHRMPDQCVVRYEELHEGDDSDKEEEGDKGGGANGDGANGACASANGDGDASGAAANGGGAPTAAANGHASAPAGGTPTGPRMKSAPENPGENGAAGSSSGGGGGGAVGGHYGEWQAGSEDKFEFPPLYECAEAVERLRPRPPPIEGDASDSHLAWAIGLQPGSALDLKYDGGWWEVELIHVWHIGGGEGGGGESGGGATDHADAANGGGTPQKAAEASYRFTVKAVDFDVEHVVTALSLRPPYSWTTESGAFRLRPPPGVYLNNDKSAPANGAGAKAKKPAKKGGKAGGKAGGGKAIDDEQPGEPSAPPTSFGVGTKRVGVDGANWEVDLRGSTNVWVREKAPGGGGSKSRKRSLE